MTSVYPIQYNHLRTSIYLRKSKILPKSLILPNDTSHCQQLEIYRKIFYSLLFSHHNIIIISSLCKYLYTIKFKINYKWD